MILFYLMDFFFAVELLTLNSMSMQGFFKNCLCILFGNFDIWQHWPSGRKQLITLAVVACCISLSLYSAVFWQISKNQEPKDLHVGSSIKNQYLIHTFICYLACFWYKCFLSVFKINQETKNFPACCIWRTATGFSGNLRLWVFWYHS